MMSTPMLRATSAWLEWARRMGMTMTRDVMALLLPSRFPSCGAMTPSGGPLRAPDEYSTEPTQRLVILFYYLPFLRSTHRAAWIHLGYPLAVAFYSSVSGKRRDNSATTSDCR